MHDLGTCLEAVPGADPSSEALAATSELDRLVGEVMKPMGKSSRKRTQ